MTTIDTIRLHKTELQGLARAYHIDPDSIRVFGSVARGEANEDSDIDLLVRPLPQCDLFDLAAFYEDAKAVLQHTVDVVSERGIPANHPIFNEAIPV